MVDERSQKNIETLAPEVQPLAQRLIETAVAQGINAKIICGTRSFEEQDKLYAQGRSRPGQVVTKARGGFSWHNYGMAFDVGIFSDDGKEYYGESAAYAEVGKIGEAIGLEWGGSWEGFPDEPHFQYNPKHYSLNELRGRHATGKDLFT